MTVTTTPTGQISSRSPSSPAERGEQLPVAVRDAASEGVLVP